MPGHNTVVLQPTSPPALKNSLTRGKKSHSKQRGSSNVEGQHGPLKADIFGQKQSLTVLRVSRVEAFGGELGGPRCFAKLGSARSSRTFHSSFLFFVCGDSGGCASRCVVTPEVRQLHLLSLLACRFCGSWGVEFQRARTSAGRRFRLQ